MQITLASDCMLDAMDAVDVGVSEMELADKLNRYGQHTSVVTVAAAGPRFVKGNLFPTDKTVQLGDTISLTVGYKGGLSSRSGFAVHDASELPLDQNDYLEKICRPYYAALCAWLKTIRCGITGGEMYQMMDEVLPRKSFHWYLNPGHLTADEEWLSSPIYSGSHEVLRSGMLLQTDFIPSIPGYAGTSAESTVALADGRLCKEIETCAPQFWQRIQDRRTYIIDELGIDISSDLLPMCSTVGYMRPYMLAKSMSMKIE